ncbi:MAG: type II/IV secretion system ATPase subunit [Candidatus Aenigmatarchaeota archaeon]
MEFKYEIKGDTLIIEGSKSLLINTLEDSKDFMEFIVLTLYRYPYINTVLIKNGTETSYLPSEILFIKEISEIYRYLVDSIGAGRLDFYPEYRDTTKEILKILAQDPILCYFKTISLLKTIKDENYKRDFLEVIREKIEKTRIFNIIKKELSNYFPGSRDLYRKIFHPIFKPPFVLSRIIIFPPENGILLERYHLKDGSEVNVYRIKDKIEVIYNIIPKEYLISYEKIRFLQEAKEKIGEIGTEIKNFENLRRVFHERVESLLLELSKASNVVVSKNEIKDLTEILVRNTLGFGILEILLQDDRIQDIYVNSPIGNSPVFINHNDYGECTTNIYITQEEAESWATKFRLYSGRPLDEANPVLDTELTLPFGRARVAAITRNLSQEGLAFAFRRHRESPWTFPLFMKVRYFNPLFAGLMNFIIDNGRSVLVAGGRGSGKTSFLSSMILELPRKYRIVILEDTPELPVEIYRKLGYNVQHLKSRSVITNVQTELSPEEALRTALRLGDSALIVGEVRSKESAVLFEAMRIGALANLVAGTIHGESAYGVYDRVVNDLGLVPTSFKALDIIVISNVLKSPDGLKRFRRIVEVVEVRKKWKEDPYNEGAFVPLLTYSAKDDTLKPTETLINGESEVLNSISKKVREWYGAWDKVWENILLRGKIKQTMLDYAEKLNRPEILEAGYVLESNESFHIISEQVLNDFGELNSEEIYNRWLKWFLNRLRG